MFGNRVAIKITKRDNTDRIMMTVYKNTPNEAESVCNSFKTLQNLLVSFMAFFLLGRR